MPEYRDYGKIGNNSFQYTSITNNYKTQVFNATHIGEERLPYMERSFISFSFGDKWIEDFNLIATIEGNNYQFNGYANFEDIVSNYDLNNGHQYWGTHFTDHELNFRLATDGITEFQLNEFLNWFAPGKTRELILSEHPNRAIMARVGAPPELSILTFKQSAVKKIANKDYETYTTLYKGYIKLQLVTEEPYWYSKVNVFGYLGNDGTYYSTWTDAAGHVNVDVYKDKDAIKIALEDNIPMSNMVQTTLLFGDNKYAISNTISGSARTAPKRDSNYPEGSWEDGQFADTNYVIAVVENGNWVSGARIGGMMITESEGVPTLNQNAKEYFYYSGNAPSYPIIKFTLTPRFNNSSYYIDVPANSFAPYNNNNYNTITICSMQEKTFTFTTPSIYTAYNQVIKILNNTSSDAAWIEVRNKIRDQVNHPAVRAWANKMIDSFDSDSVGSSLNTLKARMKYLFYSKDSTPQILSSTFMFDSKTGQAKAELQYRKTTSSTPTSSNWQTYGNVVNLEENVGDMVRSNYLIIEDRNYPTSSGTITNWRNTSETTRRYSHYITHNVPNGLKNIFIFYKNMYL